MVDRWGRPIGRPSVSPSPIGMHPRAPPQGMPGSPAKGGLGMTLRNDIKGDLRVTEIAVGGPAATDGQLCRGDIIAVIAGRNVRGMSVVQAKDLIMGPEGSTVVLGVQRDSRAGSGPGEFFEVNLIRASLPANRSRFQSPMVGSGRRQPPMNTPSPSPYTNRGGPYQQPEFSPAPHRPDAPMRLDGSAEPGMRAPVQVNESMCGIGVFIEASQNGLFVSGLMTMCRHTRA